MEFLIIFISLFIVFLLIEFISYIDKYFFKHKCYKCGKEKKGCIKVICFSRVENNNVIKHICGECIKEEE